MIIDDHESQLTISRVFCNLGVSCVAQDEKIYPYPYYVHRKTPYSSAFATLHRITIITSVKKGPFFHLVHRNPCQEHPRKAFDHRKNTSGAPDPPSFGPPKAYTPHIPHPHGSPIRSDAKTARAQPPNERRQDHLHPSASQFLPPSSIANPITCRWPTNHTQYLKHAW